MPDLYIILGILGALVVLFIIIIISVYNGLVSKREAVRNDYRQIDIQLDRRFKVFENLISVVKSVMDYEKTTLKDVVALRSQAVEATQSGDQEGKMAAENKISQIVKGLNVQLEAYPELKANQNALQLQEEISTTENKLAFAKQAYNDGVERFNRYRLTFPTNVIANMFSGFSTFTYWKLEDEDKAKKEDYTVKL